MIDRMMSLATLRDGRSTPNFFPYQGNTWGWRVRGRLAA